MASPSRLVDTDEGAKPPVCRTPSPPVHTYGAMTPRPATEPIPITRRPSPYAPRAATPIPSRRAPGSGRSAGAGDSILEIEEAGDSPYNKPLVTSCGDSNAGGRFRILGWLLRPFVCCKNRSNVNEG